MAVTILSELYRSPQCGLSLGDIKPQSIVFLRKEIRTMLERLWLVQEDRRKAENKDNSTSSSSAATNMQNNSTSPVNSSASSSTVKIIKKIGLRLLRFLLKF